MLNLDAKRFVITPGHLALFRLGVAPHTHVGGHPSVLATVLVAAGASVVLLSDHIVGTVREQDALMWAAEKLEAGGGFYVRLAQPVGAP